MYGETYKHLFTLYIFLNYFTLCFREKNLGLFNQY